MKNKKTKIITSIGGQALIEGIMMRGPKTTSIDIRTPDNEIYEEKVKTESISDRFKFLKLPFLRGIAGIYDSLKIGHKALSLSAEKAAELEEDDNQEPSKFENFIIKTFGDNLMKVLIAVASAIGIALAMLLFLFLPSFIFNVTLGKIEGIGSTQIYRSLFEGIIKILIFIGYMLLCAKQKDIKRVFQYHGAEHKTIFCYENCEELTVENVKKQSRFHPRCGTSFIVVMLLVGILIGMIIPFSNSALRTICKILLIPLMASLGYEFIRLCGKYDNKITIAIAFPGLLMQRISTKEPDDDMIEVAIKAMKSVIPENHEDQIKNDTE